MILAYSLKSQLSPGRGTDSVLGCFKKTSIGVLLRANWEEMVTYRKWVVMRESHRRQELPLLRRHIQ